MMEFHRLSTMKVIKVNATTVGEAKKTIAKIEGVSHLAVHVVEMDNGSIYADDRQLKDLKRPLEYMIENETRIALEETQELCVIMVLPANAKMSCGHFVDQDGLVGHLKDCLVTRRLDVINCPKCGKEWEFDEIKSKGDLSEDENILYQRSLTMNFTKNNSKISQCPNCMIFCERIEESTGVRCPDCTKKFAKGFDFCWFCKCPWSPSHKCCDTLDKKHFQEILENAPKISMGYSHIPDVPSIRMCPYCHILIEHVKDCKQMTCKECKTGFCFSCLTLVDSDNKLACTAYTEKCDVAPIQIIP